MNGAARSRAAAVVAVGGSVATVVDRAPGAADAECSRAVRTVSRLDPARREARSVARRADPAQLEQPHHPRPLAAIRLEQLEHPGVVAARLTGQGVGDEVRQVEVADAHRVGVAERPDADLGRGPRPDPRDGGQPRVRLGERQVDDRLEPRRPRGDAPDELGPATFDAERVVGVVGERGERRRRRREPEPELGRARGRLAVDADQAEPAPGAPRRR